MAEADIVRKLTAIFYADVAGYSRLTGSDEEGSHRRVMAALDLTTETIEARGGAVLRYAGDAVLAEFRSVIAAIDASIAIQTQLQSQNQNIPQDRMVQLRIGINVGDVMEDRGEIFGDGVNLAARLEATAEPGGICISSAVYEQVRGKVDLEFIDGGQEEFKNIANPVHIYRWRPESSGEAGEGDAPLAKVDPVPTPAAPVIPTPAVPTPAVPTPTVASKRSDKPSIAVLPFANMSGDAEQEYFSDGITEDIITDLSKISGLFIIARNTVFAYKGRNVDLTDVSRELGVRYILEGSVRKVGERVRITAQLIDGDTGGHVWADRYDRDLEDIFGVQDEVTEEIVTALRVHVSDAERRRLVRKETDNLDAYDDLLKGRELFLRFTVEGNLEAEQKFRRAIKRDPTYAAAYAELARALVQRRNHGWGSAPGQELAEGFRMASKAVELDGTVAQARIVKGFVHLWRHEHDQALAELDAGLALDPNHADGHMWKAIVSGFVGDPEQGVREVQLAMRLNPGSPFWYLFALGNACFAMWRYEECVEACGKAVDKNPNFIFAQMLLAAGLGQLGRTEEADRALAECRRLNPRFSLDWAKDLVPYKEQASIDRFVSGLRKAGLEE
jgi:adenylate cyclase